MIVYANCYVIITKVTVIADPIKLSFFPAKLGHFTIGDFFLYVTKHSN